MSDPQNPSNHPIYVISQSMDSCILQLNRDFIEPTLKESKLTKELEGNENDALWKLFFDGSSSKEGAGACIVLISPANEVFSFSYKLEFETTNNIVKYEALILGLKATKDLNVKRLEVFGDSKLIILQVKNKY